MVILRKFTMLLQLMITALHARQITLWDMLKMDVGNVTTIDSVELSVNDEHVERT